ncbi:hypothetical protein CP8484711_0927A, partial [Chlamydia psittaci 84-8471/1]
MLYRCLINFANYHCIRELVSNAVQKIDRRD